MQPANSVLVVAAHPDDEVLGCGGTIARHSAAGDAVTVAILAEGATSRDRVRNVSARDNELSALGDAARAAGRILGAQVELFGLPDNRLDSLDLLDIAKLVEDLIDRIRPSVVFTHHAGDLNIDHRRIHEAVLIACRPVPSHPVRRILAFEVPSSTDWLLAHSGSAFAPNWFEDITQTLEKKLAALDAYVSEMRPWPHARSIRAIEHLARWRGATVGVEAAEAFQLIRNLS